MGACRARSAPPLASEAEVQPRRARVCGQAGGCTFCAITGCCRICCNGASLASRGVSSEASAARAPGGCAATSSRASAGSGAPAAPSTLGSQTSLGDGSADGWGVGIGAASRGGSRRAPLVGVGAGVLMRVAVTRGFILARLRGQWVWVVVVRMCVRCEERRDGPGDAPPHGTCGRVPLGGCRGYAGTRMWPARRDGRR